MKHIKYVIAVLLLFICFGQANAQTGQPTELILVSQPTMSYQDDGVRLYYDLQNIGTKRYKGKVYIYLDPDNGYYYAAKKVRICKGRIKRVKIDVPTAGLMKDSLYTVMPYYSIGSQLHSFTIFEDFGLLSFRISQPAQNKYVVVKPLRKPYSYTCSPNATRYYYDGYYRAKQVNLYYSMPYHHTYQYHHLPNHGYYGPYYVTPQGNPMTYPYNNPPKPNNSWNHTTPPRPITTYNPPQPNPVPHNNGTSLNPNNQASVHQSSPGSMSSNNAIQQNNGNNNQGGTHDGNNAGVNNHNATQHNSQNQSGTAGRNGATSRNNTTTGNVNSQSTSGTTERTGTTTSGRNNAATAGSSNAGTSTSGATGRTNTTTTQRTGSTNNGNDSGTNGSASSRAVRQATTQSNSNNSTDQNTGATTRDGGARTQSSTRSN